MYFVIADLFYAFSISKPYVYVYNILYNRSQNEKLLVKNK